MSGRRKERKSGAKGWMSALDERKEDGTDEGGDAAVRGRNGNGNAKGGREDKKGARDGKERTARGGGRRDDVGYGGGTLSVGVARGKTREGKQATSGVEV
jgi:hypothetical protein